jgi:Ferritin-like domain
MHEPGRVSRRQLLRIGGTTIAAAVLVAACRESGDDDSSAMDERARPSRADREMLRTASSLDELAVVVYSSAIDSGLVTTPEATTTLELCRRHHREHADLFASATADVGGEPFRRPNPVVMQALRPALDAADDQRAVLAVALDVERLLAETYQSFVGAFTDRGFDVAVMSVGGTEASHAALIAPGVGQPAAAAAFQPTAAAVASGTGLPGG